jgi:hypothetical protein
MSRSVEEQMLNPRPGSAAAAARDFGIDLTLLVRRLKLTPEERLEELQRAMEDLEQARSSIRQREKYKPDD